MNNVQKNKKISIVVPVYNRVRELRELLESIKTQTHKNYEIIIIDDCSRELIRDVVNEYSMLPIKYFRNSQRKGASVSKNIGIKNSQGDYILFLDSDTELINIKQLANMVGTMERQRETVAVGGEMKCKAIKFRWHGQPKEICANHETETDNMSTANLMTRADIAKKIMFNEGFFWMGEDRLFCIQLGKLGKLLTSPHFVAYHKYAKSERMPLIMAEKNLIKSTKMGLGRWPAFFLKMWFFLRRVKKKYFK